jgi:hypothetical protein
MGVRFFLVSKTLERGTSLLNDIAMQRGVSAENILEHLSDLEHYPEEALAPYQEFEVGTRTYCFTPGGFLYQTRPVQWDLCNFIQGFQFPRRPLLGIS